MDFGSCLSYDALHSRFSPEDGFIAGSNGQIQSVARASRLLLFVSSRDDGCTAQEAAVAHELALPTAYHILNTLVAEGLLVKDSRRRYVMGPKVGALSDAFMRQLSVPEYLAVALRTLAEETGETAYLTAWRGAEIRLLACVEGRQAVRVAGLHSGFYTHGHARATGKLLLAYARADVREAYLRDNPPVRVTDYTITETSRLQREFELIRERGFSYDVEEFAVGVGCVAAPVMADNHVLAAFTVSAPIDRFTERRAVLTDAVLAVARGASSAPAPPSAAATRLVRHRTRRTARSGSSN